MFPGAENHGDVTVHCHPDDGRHRQDPEPRMLADDFPVWKKKKLDSKHHFYNTVITEMEMHFVRVHLYIYTSIQLKHSASKTQLLL